jgi:hypothetical protein
MNFDLSKLTVWAERGLKGIDYKIVYRDSAVMAGTGPFKNLFAIIAAAQDGVARMMEQISKSSDEFEAAQWVQNTVIDEVQDINDLNITKVRNNLINRIAARLNIPADFLKFKPSNAASAQRQLKASEEALIRRIQNMSDESAARVLEILNKKDKTEKDKAELSNALGKRKLDLDD